LSGIPYPSEKYDMSKSVGMMKFPICGKSKNSMDPNHQPLIVRNFIKTI
jgi:hypothetical protein